MSKYLPQKQTRERYQVTDMTLHRWRESRGFPQPHKFAGRNYYLAEELDEFDEKNFARASRAGGGVA